MCQEDSFLVTDLRRLTLVTVDRVQETVYIQIEYSEQANYNNRPARNNLKFLELALPDQYGFEHLDSSVADGEQ
jgi:hypothetical protein